MRALTYPTMLILALSGVVPAASAHAASVHLTTSTPWFSYADPLASETAAPLIAAVFDSLTEVSGNGTVIPALAESWSISPDKKTWSFTLRPNVVFSDGAPLDANAVVDCFTMLLAPESTAARNAFYTNSIMNVRAVDPRTVEIQTHNIDARLDRKLSKVRVFSVPAFNRLGRTAFSKSPVGTGPYRVESWPNSGRGVVLRGVPTSWRTPVQVDRVEILYVPDAGVRTQTLLSGATDIAHAIDPDSLSVVENAGFKTSVEPGSVILAIALRTTGGAAAPLGDSRVRVALNMAIKRSEISQNLLLGTMEPALQIATPDVLGYDSTIPAYAFDPDRAKKLLADAGYPDGFRMSAALYVGQAPGDHLIYQQVAQNLAAIGVNFEIQIITINDHLRRRAAGSWDGIDAISSSWSHYILGDISRAAEQFSCLEPASSFCDQDLSAVITRSNEETDPVAREGLLKTINARFQDLAPSILLFRFSSIDGMAQRIQHFPQATAKIYFEKMRVAD
jgi:peptide/nickel transport system substrate-binding protein